MAPLLHFPAPTWKGRGPGWTVDVVDYLADVVLNKPAQPEAREAAANAIGTSIGSHRAFWVLQAQRSNCLAGWDTVVSF